MVDCPGRGSVSTAQPKRSPGLGIAFYRERERKRGGEWRGAASVKENLTLDPKERWSNWIKAIFLWKVARTQRRSHNPDLCVVSLAPTSQIRIRIRLSVAWPDSASSPTRQEKYAQHFLSQNGGTRFWVAESATPQHVAARLNRTDRAASGTRGGLR